MNFPVRLAGSATEVSVGPGTNLNSVRVQTAGPPEDTEYVIAFEPKQLRDVVVSAPVDVIEKIESGDAVVIAIVHLKSTEKEARAGELRIGVAPGLSGRRWQEEVSISEARRRVVEEIRVELTNDAEQDASVDVVEHMVRGLNWSLAYHNKVGTAAKRGPQEVRFSVNVPAESTVLLMYRVVYTW